MPQIIGLIDGILTMVLFAALWQMYEMNQPHQPEPGKLDLAGTLPVPDRGEASALARALQEVRGAGGFDDLDAFVQGARQAYEAVVGAYGAGDVGPVAGMLAPEVRAAFEAAIAGRAIRGETLIMVFIGFAAAEPVDAGVEGRNCWITIRFEAQMVSAITGRDGRVIAGHPHRVGHIVEVWSFARQTRSPDPNWVIVGTGEDA